MYDARQHLLITRNQETIPRSQFEARYVFFILNLRLIHFLLSRYHNQNVVDFARRRTMDWL